MQQNLQTIRIQDILRLSSFADESALGDDFIIGETTGVRASRDGRLLDLLQYPVRFDGYILFFLKKGHFRIDFNLNSYDVREHSLLVSVPGNIIRITSPLEDQMKETELIFVFISRQFVSGLHLDFNRTFQESIRLLENPCVTLGDEQLALAESYFLLARQILASSHRNKREIISGLLSSLSYMTEDVWSEQLQQRAAVREENTTRANQLFDRFMQLVTQYHGTERGMAFYADRMNLTPKYLSRVVKEASGRSGPEWIDAYVVLEAKNLLRYSSESIKEIVYKLNFPNSSVFNKFFRLHTGMSPSEYRRQGTR
ncbi:MAG: AraC family transcriptional regulator [Bacteroidales bacterium]|nr:AraC family transcriptional regulator [Bacteroidales bacterium]